MPSVSVKVNIVNFMITVESLADQILGQIVKNERKELELERERLVLESAENRKQLKLIEDKIL